MSTKTRSALSEPPTKVSAATTRLTKTSKGGAAKSKADAASPLQRSPLSTERSPRSAPLKPAVERRSPKLTTLPEKKATEVEAELNLAQEELKKAKEKLVLVQNELKEARRLAEEANEKLREASVARKRAEKNSEIEKFRAVEMEQAGIEAVHTKEEEWRKELEAVRNQHAVDVAALLSATQEVQKVKQELAFISDAKELALQHAEEATDIAEAQAQKVEALSSELAHVKSLLHSRAEMEARETDKYVSELKLKLDSLNQEVEKAKLLEDRLAEKEATLEQLNVEVEAAKKAELYAHNLVDELQERVGELSSQAEQAKRLERSASESLESVIKQLEGRNDSLREAETQIGSLKEKVVLLEISCERQKRDLEESDILLELAREEASEMAKKLETLKEAKARSLKNEKRVETLLEEKDKLINELGSSRDEEEKSKKALESLASPLHEVSSEARDAKEKLLSSQAEHENYEVQIEDLKLVLKATNEKYERILDDAKQEIAGLTNSIQHSKQDHQNLKAKWEDKELHLMNSINKSEEEKSNMESEISRLVNLLKVAEEETCTTREEEEHWRKAFKEAESETINLKEVLSEAKTDNMRLEEGLMERENELLNIIQENDVLWKSEASSLKKIEELSTLLEEALVKKQGDENGELIESEKYLQNGTEEMKPKVEVQSQETELQPPAKEILHKVNDAVRTSLKMENSNGRVKENSIEKDDHETAEVDVKMWDSCKFEETDYSQKRGAEQESFEDEPEHSADSYDQVNGHSSTKQNGQKKKTPLLRKFGNLLKKKGITNQK